MEDLLEKLIALLERKHEALQRLISGQERFKQFLVKPRWSKFADVTQPQESLLLKLRQMQAAQDYLLASLAGKLGKAEIATIKELCRLLPESWRRAIFELSQKIKDAAARLQGLSRLSQSLNQAQWRYAHGMLNGGAAPETSHINGYDARGHASAAPLLANRVYQQA